jgi:predicted acetyltransferase
MTYAFEPKAMRVRHRGAAGSWRRVGPEAWRDLDDVFVRHWAKRNGALARTEQRWRYSILQDYARGERDAAIWRNDSGEARGYVVYGTQRRPLAGSPFGETVLRVHDWAALDADAYAAVLQYLLNHDLASRIVMLCSPDEPLPEAFDEPVHISEPPGAWFGMCLRLVDVPRALEARPALPRASGRELTLRLTDEKAPWNAGTWHIECCDGRIAVRAASGAADVEMDVRALAPLYNGFIKPADAVRVGSVRAVSDEAVAAATDIFSTTYAPYCPDEF